MAKQQYSSKFKMEAIKRVEASEGSITSVAKELGIKQTPCMGG